MPKACILCKCEKYQTIWSYQEPDQYEAHIRITAEDYYRAWVQCTNCGFYYSIYSRPENALDELYETAYRGNVPWRKMGVEETFKKVTALPPEKSETKTRINWIKGELARLRKEGFVPERLGPYELLDIGGGNGIMGYEFQDKDWKSSVIDPNDGVSFVKTVGLDYEQGFYKPGMFTRKFDMLSLVNVLEHVLDPVAVLDGIARDLNPGGFIYIEVPDAINFKLKPKDDDIFNSCHLWFWDPITLAGMLNRVGYDPLAVKRFHAAKGHYGLMVLAAAN